MRPSQIAQLSEYEARALLIRLLADPTDLACQDAALLLQVYEEPFADWLLRDYPKFRTALLVHNATLASAAYSMLVRQLKQEDAAAFFRRAADHGDFVVIETLVNARPELRPTLVDAGVTLPAQRALATA